MEWAYAVLTVITSELLARKSWHGWGVGLVNDGFWFWWAYSGGHWGMFSLTAVCTLQSVRGLLRWRREAA
jgi:hypothetical protein